MKVIFLNLIAIFCFGAHADLPGTFSVVQGMTDQTRVEFSVLQKKKQTLKFFAQGETSGLITAPDASRVETRPDSDWAVAKIHFSGLSLKEHYQLLIEDERGLLLETRRFSMLDLDRKDVRIAVVSCAAGYLYEQSMWEQLSTSNPDLIFYNGDNIYADRPNLITKRPANPKQLWEAYIDGRRTYDIYMRHELIPSLATWDDHDFGADDSDDTYPYRDDSLRTFNVFWAQGDRTSPRLGHGPGVSSALLAFGQTFVFLDNRYYRTPEDDHSVNRTGWGVEQNKWLAGQLKNSRGLLWLINGQQFFGGYRGKDAVEFDFPEEFERLKTLVRQRPDPVAFISGDVHFSELMDIEPAQFGYPTVEITSSSMHSITFPGQHLRHSNPRRRAATSGHNFVILELHSGDRSVTGRVISQGVDRALFSEPLILNLR